MTTISVIIPTTCDARRAGLIQRALDSVDLQHSVTVQTVLVANGPSVNEDLLKRISSSWAKVIRLEEGNVSKARFAGLQASTGDFFCFLDDDDEFLPGALAHRLSLFEDGVDCVVTNGLVNDAPLVSARAARLANADPAAAFFVQNWFASPGSMFRRGAFDGLFDMDHKYFEWTLLFFRLLSAGHRIKYDDAKTYCVWQNSPGSASSSAEYELAHADVLADILALPLGEDALAALRLKHHTALNAKSQLHLERRQRLEAWKSHLSCLKSGGWRYLPFTRKLFF